MKKLLILTLPALCFTAAKADEVGISFNLAPEQTDIDKMPTFSYSTDFGDIGISLSGKWGEEDFESTVTANDGAGRLANTSGTAYGAPGEIGGFQRANLDDRGYELSYSTDIISLSGSIDTALASGDGWSTQAYATAAYTLTTSNGSYDLYQTGTTTGYGTCTWDSTETKINLVGGVKASYTASLGGNDISFDYTLPLGTVSNTEVSGTYDATSVSCSGSGSGALDQDDTTFNLFADGGSGKITLDLFNTDTASASVSASLFTGAPSFALALTPVGGLGINLGITSVSGSTGIDTSYAASFGVTYTL